MTEEIRDGVFGFVSGTVSRVFTTKNGRALEIEVKDQRQQYPDRWTIWGDLPVSEGDRVTVKGWLAVGREKYTDRDGAEQVAVRRAVNKPELTAHEVVGVDARADVWPADDSWDTAPVGGGFDADAPF